MEVAERVRKAIYDLNLPHEGSQSADRVTVSIGVVSLIHSDAVTPANLIEVVDKALYEAKKGGRNRIRKAGRGI